MTFGFAWNLLPRKLRLDIYYRRRRRQKIESTRQREDQEELSPRDNKAMKVKVQNKSARGARELFSVRSNCCINMRHFIGITRRQAKEPSRTVVSP